MTIEKNIGETTNLSAFLKDAPSVDEAFTKGGGTRTSQAAEFTSRYLPGILKDAKMRDHLVLEVQGDNGLLAKAELAASLGGVKPWADKGEAEAFRLLKDTVNRYTEGDDALTARHANKDGRLVLVVKHRVIKRRKKQ